MNLIQRYKCPFCYNLKFISLFKKEYSSEELKKFIFEYYQSHILMRVVENHIYEICECSNCKGLFQKYEPDSQFSSFLYDKIISTINSYKKKYDYENKNRNKLNQDYLMIKNLFLKELKDIKILEFGCGWGSWASFMKSKSLNITTCEFSETRHQYLIKNKIKNFKNLSDIKEKFDFIYSEEVLEHVSSPLDILMSLSILLSKNGFMFHRFPSSYLFKNKLNRNYIPKKDCAHPLEHLNIISKKSFLKMCKFVNLEFSNELMLKNQNFITKIKMLKNDFVFNNALLKNKY